MAYTGGSEAGAHAAEAQLSSLAKAAGICFRFDQRTDWQPVESHPPPPPVLTGHVSSFPPY